MKRQLKDWPEASEREVRWVNSEEAAALIDDDGLRSLAQEFASRLPFAPVRAGRKGDRDDRDESNKV